jgi:hypothetical protein
MSEHRENNIANLQTFTNKNGVRLSTVKEMGRALNNIVYFIDIGDRLTRVENLRRNLRSLDDKEIVKITNESSREKWMRDIGYYKLLLEELKNRKLIT